MFHRAIAIFILVALLGTNFTRFFVYAGFEVNKKYIAEKLCVNRSRPWLHCNGRCYFMKKIKQAEEDEKKQEKQDQKNRYQEALPVAQTITKAAFKETGNKPDHPRFVSPRPIRRPYPILLPPKVA